MPTLKDWQSQLGKLALPYTNVSENTPAFFANDEQAIVLFRENYAFKLRLSLRNTYPYTCALLEQTNNLPPRDWMSLFLSGDLIPSHKMHVTLSGFPAFLQAQKNFTKQYPFLGDLARYEWLISDINASWHIDTPGNLLDAVPSIEQATDYRPFLNPLSAFFQSPFPIRKICEQINQEAFSEIAWSTQEPTELLIYRNSVHLCRTFEFQNRLSGQLLSLCTCEHSYRHIAELLYQTSPELHTYPSESVTQQTLEFFDSCFKDSILLGSIPVH